MAIAALIFGLVPKAGATSILTATGTLTETATSAGSNTFTLTLQNTSVSLAIETFWFAWTPGQDYLATDPLTVQAPTGWSATAEVGGASNGYSIQFNLTTGTPLAAGSGLSGFGFTTADSLATMKANSIYFATPTTTSQVSTLPGFGGTSSSSFVVAVVPEPASVGLVIAGSAVLCLWNKRRRA